MAQRLSRPFFATFFLLLAVPFGAAQSPGLPKIPLPANFNPPPKSSEPTPAGQKLPAQEVDGVTEKLPPAHVTRSRTFNLPVVMEKSDRALVSEIRLYMKTPSSDWTLQEKGGPDLTQFSLKVEKDGEYWYLLALVDKAGKMTPADVNAEAPNQRVIVNTAQPKNPSDVTLPSPPPIGFPGTQPKPPEPVPTAKELSAQEVDELIVKAFGKDSAELMRPVRLWLPSIGTVIAAQDARIARDDGSVRFTTASVGVGTLTHVLRGDQVVLFADRPVTQWKELTKRQIVKLEVENKNATITLTPTPASMDANTIFTTVGTKIGSATVPQPDEPKKPIELPPQPNPGGLPNAQPGRVVVESTPPIGMPGGILPAMEVRFKFKIDPKASLTDLLPTPRKTSAKLPLWTNEDLTKVPELTFGEPISKELPKHKAMEATAHRMAKINHLNLKKTDGFMLAMLEQRSDLRGLPFLMGDDCRTHEEDAKIFNQAAELLSRTKHGNMGRTIETGDHLEAVITQDWNRFNVVERDRVYRAAIAVMTQILMPEPEVFRLGMARYLAKVPHIDASKALAKLAIFSPEESVRAAAIEGLKSRREKDYTDVLMQGFRYPLPAVSKRAAEALVKLERKDLLVNLIEVLESPDPRLPVTDNGKTVVRELVKVNHHRNCLLCHAPGNTDNTPEGVLKVAVPLPGEPLPKPSEGGGYQSTPPATPDIVVRLDMTYLRQDFSVMMPVSDAHPWPEMQRFDFLVRSRTLTAAAANEYREEREPGQLSPYHRAALFALRELTGRDTEPTAAAWRKLLKLAVR